MKQIFYFREETTQGVAFLKSEIRCSISSKKVLCITKKKNRPTLRYILKKVGSKLKPILDFLGYILIVADFIGLVGFIASLFC